MISRLGAVVTPNTAGASTLAAMAVPADRLDEVADIVSAEPGVNHNYEREHAFNLWFVVTQRRDAVREHARPHSKRHGLPVIDLPLEKAYHIDLGFPYERSIQATGRCLQRSRTACRWCPIPYAEVARQIGASETT